MLRHFAFAAGLTAALLALPASASLAPTAPVPVDPALRTGKLENGLTYYIRRNGSPQKRIELRLVVRAGSVLEDDDQQGLAHFVEHMAFNGSTHFRRQELVSFLQSIGVQFGADLNAYTSYDETVYTLSLPSGQRQHVDTAFTVLEDWAHGIAFDDEAIEKERPILLEEMNLRGGAGERIERQLRPRLFNGARYAGRTPIGKAEILRTAPPETIRRFYRDWYRPDLMAVVVVGDIAPADAERLLRQHFAGLVNPAAERPRDEVAIPLEESRDALVAVDPEAAGSNLTVRYPIEPAPWRGSVGVARARLLYGMLGNLLDGRLDELASRPEPPFAWASTGISYMNPRYRYFAMDAGINGRGTTAALTALARTVAQVREAGFSDAELERVRLNRMRANERMFSERSSVRSAIYAGEYVRNFLAGETLPSRETEYFQTADLLAGITLAEVNALARSAIPADGARLLIYRGMGGPDKPSASSLLAALESAQRAAPGTWQASGPARQWMSAPPAPGRVVARTEDGKLGLTRLVLANGVQVILKPTRFQHDQILLGAIRDGGLVQFAQPDLPDARYADAVAGAMGAGDLSPLEIQRRFAGTRAWLGTGMNLYTDIINAGAGANPRDLETMLQMLWLRFNKLRRDPALFQTFVRDETRRLTNNQAVPALQVSRAIFEGLYGTQPYAPHFLEPADARSLDLDRSLALYRQHFSSAAGFTFILVGSFQVEQVIPLLETYLGSLATPPRTVPPRDVGVRPARGVIRRAVHGGDQGEVRLVFTGATEFSEAEDWRLAALVEVMNLRIVDVLRTRLGLVYAGSVSKSLERLPYPSYTVEVSIPTSPEHVEKLRTAIFAEIERMQREGPTMEELDKVRLAWAERYRQALQDNGVWLGRLQASTFDGIDPSHILNFEQDSAALTPAQVQAAARRYFDLANYLEVVLTPSPQGAPAYNP